MTQQVTLADEDLHNLFDLGDFTDEWIFVSTPYQVPAILACYLLIVLKLGPQFMKERPAVDLNIVLRIYNLLQVFCNGFLFCRLVTDSNAIDKLINHSCSIEDHELLTEDKKLLVYYAWVYLVLKLSDLLDTFTNVNNENTYLFHEQTFISTALALYTVYSHSFMCEVFMVLRKKDSHITFLHVYHHAAMVFFVWLSFTYSRSHHGLVPGVVNATVHTIMYSYYFLATFPSLKPMLWWKKHLTKLQLGQFVVILLYFSVIYYNNCFIPQIFTYIWIINVSVICLLFINFYVKAYTTNKTAVKVKSS